jgi:hypothetical protein
LVVPDQLLLFLHAFFQTSGIRGNFKGGRLIERDEFRYLPTCLRVRRHGGGANRKPDDSGTARRGDHLEF